jgi:hypothetical protein
MDASVSFDLDSVTKWIYLNRCLKSKRRRNLQLLVKNCRSNSQKTPDFPIKASIRLGWTKRIQLTGSWSVFILTMFSAAGKPTIAVVDVAEATILSKSQISIVTRQSCEIHIWAWAWLLELLLSSLLHEIAMTITLIQWWMLNPINFSVLQF